MLQKHLEDILVRERSPGNTDVDVSGKLNRINPVYTHPLLFPEFGERPRGCEDDADSCFAQLSGEQMRLGGGRKCEP